MSAQTLRAISRLRGLNQSELARMSGVSRQAVSLWLKAAPGAPLDIKASHLKRLAHELRLSADDLLRPLPILDDPEEAKRWGSTLLWDRLYPTLTDFAVALLRGEEPALARLAQVFGLYRAGKVGGRKIWERFQSYKRHIRPVRREQLESVWQYRQSLTSN